MIERASTTSVTLLDERISSVETSVSFHTRFNISAKISDLHMVINFFVVLLPLPISTYTKRTKAYFGMLRILYPLTQPMYALVY